jgi:hypothetical protein
MEYLFFKHKQIGRECLVFTRFSSSYRICVVLSAVVRVSNELVRVRARDDPTQNSDGVANIGQVSRIPVSIICL